jgi:membrane-associated protein
VARVTTTLALGPEWLQPDTIIAWLGPWALVGLAVIIFAECGLLLGFFLPGDSLLFTAGLFAVNDQLPAPLWAVVVLLVVAAFAGNVCGYYIGRFSGPAIFDRPKSRLFKPEHVVKTQAFFDKYGNRAIVLGRFVPVVRTFITVMAGVGRMPARQYFTYSLIGGVLWAAGVTLLGAVLGQFEFVRTNIELILILVVLLSVLPIVVELLRARREKRHAASGAGPDTAVDVALDTVAGTVAPGSHAEARPAPGGFAEETVPIPRHQPQQGRPYPGPAPVGQPRPGQPQHPQPGPFQSGYPQGRPPQPPQPGGPRRG